MATITRGTTFISGDLITPAKLHQLVDTATVTNIANADISASAAIAGSKIAPDFADIVNLQKIVTETKSTPTITSGVLALDLSAAALFYVSLSANITNLTLSNVPASPKVFSFMLQFPNTGTVRTVVWPASMRWGGGTAPTMTGTNGKVDTFSFITHDGGVNWFAFIVEQNQ
jgi:hypothetical protein